MLLRHLGWILLFNGIAFSVSAQDPAGSPDTFKLLPKDVYFQPGGGIRFRYDHVNDATLGSFSSDEEQSLAQHRAQIDLKLYKGEFFESFFRLINYSDWGSSIGDSSGAQRDSLSRTNGLLVNEAWGLWKVSQSMGITFGRAPIHLGIGYTYGHNDWFNVPYTFDQLKLSWNWSSLDLALIAAQVRDLQPVVGQPTDADPEETHIIVDINLKNVSDILDVANFSIVQVNRNMGSTDGTAATMLNGLNMQRLALETEIRGKRFFGTAFFTYVTGEETIAPANLGASTVGTLDLKQYAYDLKLGYAFPQSSNLRFWGGYHFDSGDRVANDGTAENFDSFYYEVYGQAGLMDFLRWGNLNFWRLGIDVEIFTNTRLGAEWLQFRRSEDSGTQNFGQAGQPFANRIASGDIVLGEGKDLGSELDMFLDVKFSSGVEFRTTLSSFFAAGIIENATVTSNSRPNGSVLQVLSQVGYFF